MYVAKHGPTYEMCRYSSNIIDYFTKEVFIKWVALYLKYTDFKLK